MEFWVAFKFKIQISHELELYVIHVMYYSGFPEWERKEFRVSHVTSR